ncbi:unnamed protein product [Staurois parvus]|uniref:Uncharacterized protein n=1 Tax=Staurois parvus TaxID=386267 RepID=A0ABN9BPN6_9NEOB|nr:unnamed protein product [Staurois parvus]
MISVAPAVPPVSAHQCHLPVLISATYQCPSELPQCHLSMPVSAAYQCQSVPAISAANQCGLSVPTFSAHQ